MQHPAVGKKPNLMKLILVTFFISLAAAAGYAQVPAAKTPTKIAVIETQAFALEKGGITRYLNAMKRLEAEFKPRRTELETMQAQYRSLEEEVRKSPAAATQAKLEQADTLKRDIERKSTDAQAALVKRQRELTDPISNDIGIALSTFATQKGIDLVLDVSNVPVTFVNPAIDITAAFIAEYNTRNPQ